MKYQKQIIQALCKELIKKEYTQSDIIITISNNSDDLSPNTIAFEMYEIFKQIEMKVSKVKC